MRASLWLMVALASIAVFKSYMQYQDDKTQAQSLNISKAYKDGYAAGAASVNTPKQCVDWWFSTDFKERHKQAQQAYCKGKK